jgi:Domain of unknown function (DUF4167)
MRPGRARSASGEQDHEDEDLLLINNRQNGRRRGRGGGPRSPNQGPNPGNRQENRSRGNAAQLHEKYKSLARDAQMQGDRVQTEYWLQFADHYFRILNENRPRFEEQRSRRDEFQDEDEGDEEQLQSADNDDGDEDEDRGGRNDRHDRQDRQDRGYRAEGDRPRRDFRRDREFEGREPREARNDREPRADREPRNDRDGGESRPVREARNGDVRPERRPRGPRREAPVETGERISLDVLPPAISPPMSVVEGDAPAKAPRRRTTRRPRAEDGGEEIAPAA